jgi:hypothetical protein
VFVFSGFNLLCVVGSHHFILREPAGGMGSFVTFLVDPCLLLEISQVTMELLRDWQNEFRNLIYS